MTAVITPISGTAYGVALNDSVQTAALKDAFHAAPYKAPPARPVLYIKPRNCFGQPGAPIGLSDGLEEVQVAATIGLLFARDCTAARPGEALAALGGVCLALDVSEPSDDFYRPQIRQQCRDGFLPLGAPASPRLAFGDIVTLIDGAVAHRWSLERLVRPIDRLLCEVSAFMTLRAGDLLLVGLAGDAPRARVGQTVRVESEGLPALQATLQAEAL